MILWSAELFFVFRVISGPFWEPSSCFCLVHVYLFVWLLIPVCWQKTTSPVSRSYCKSISKLLTRVGKHQTPAFSLSFLWTFGGDPFDSTAVCWKRGKIADCLSFFSSPIANLWPEKNVSLQIIRLAGEREKKSKKGSVTIIALWSGRKGPTNIFLNDYLLH